MNVIRDFVNAYLDQDDQVVALKTLGCTGLSAICGYGGTFFFTSLNPTDAGVYFALVSLTAQLGYQILGKIKASIGAPLAKHVITIVQLLQIPVLFYVFPDPFGLALSGITKLQMITATAYFIAIPVFFHLAILAWNEPTEAHITAAMGVLLPLASGLGNYAKVFG